MKISKHFLLILLLVSVLVLLYFITKKCTSCPGEIDECYTNNLPVYHGKNDTSVEKSLTNISIDTAHVTKKDNQLIFEARISCNKNGNGDDDAHHIVATVLLPPEINIISFSGPDSCLVLKQHRTDHSINTGYITFSKDHLANSRESFSIQIVTSTPKKEYVNPPQFAIFIRNQIPELIYGDNFRICM